MDRILVLSEGPPPLGDTFAEGGALRAWGLAKGFITNGHEVTFAYRSTFEIGNYESSEIPKGINLSVWDGEKIQSLLDSHKIIVLRYAMGEAAQIVLRLKEDHILVSDSYIPISIEVSARKSNDSYEQDNYLRLQLSSKIASRRADYILYSSPSQKLYYLGYLAGINKINPRSYDELSKRMFEVPYGVDLKEMPKRVTKPPEVPTLLWYGAFYSWFDMESIIESIKKLSNNIPGFKFMVAGAKNPYNKDPGILSHYDKTMKSIREAGISVEYIDWHPYSERFSIYSKATAIITQNHLGLENELAWRTRLMDYVLSMKPILTNGGDPLGEDLIKRGIAFKIDSNNLEDKFCMIMKKPPEQALFNDVAIRYSWDSITEDISLALEAATRYTSGDMELKLSPKMLAKKIAKKTFRYPLYVKNNGINKSAQKFKNKLVTRDGRK